jgi:hypothetical protein
VIRPKTTITATSGLVTIFILWSVVGSREKKGRELVKGTDRQREREKDPRRLKMTGRLRLG